MALVVLPEGTQISGSIGGTTWSHNRFGAYKRNRSIPVNPNTPRQVAVRNRVRALAIAWENTLTQAQRDAWKLYASNVPWVNKLGQSVFLTGLNMYVRSNTIILGAGVTRVDDAPTIFTLATAELGLDATASEATQLITISFDVAAAWVPEAGAAQAMFAGAPQNAGIVFFGGPYRLVGNVLGAVIPPTSPVTFTSGFPFAAGQRMWVKTRIFRADGRLSEPTLVNFLAAA